MLQRQSLAVFILLSVVTCGIYSLIWIYNTTMDINNMAAQAGAPPEVMHNPVNELLLCIVTCGIYTFIWYYKQGNKMKDIAYERDIPVREDGSAYILFLLLSSVTCGIFGIYAMHLFIKNYNLLADDYNISNSYNEY